MTKSINKAHNGFVVAIIDKQEHFINPNQIVVDGVSLADILSKQKEHAKDIAKLKDLIDKKDYQLKVKINDLNEKIVIQQIEINRNREMVENIIRGFIKR